MNANRNSRSTLVRIAAMLTLILAAATTQAQEMSFDYLTQALAKIVAHATIVNLANYDYIAGDSLYGAYLNSGESQALNPMLNEGEEYLILGGGDQNINDLDLTILNSSGTELMKDTETDAMPLVRFTPRFTGRYTVKMTNYASAGQGFCAFVILRKSENGSLNIEQIAQALDNAVKCARVASLFSGRFATGTFCLFGGKRSPGEDSSLYNNRLNSGRYIFLSAGSDNVTDLDNFVARQSCLDDTSGNIIERDTDLNNHPICTFNASASDYYLLRHKVATAHNDSEGFVFSVLLRLDD